VTIGPDLTFSAAAQLWIDSRKVKAPGGRSKYVSENTLWYYEQYARALDKMFAGTPLGEFSKNGLGLIREYHRLRSIGHDPDAPDDPESPRWEKPAGPNKINQEVWLLTRVLRFAGIWNPEIEKEFEPLPREESDVPRALTPEEQAHWLDTASSVERWQLVWLYSILGLHTTASTNELRALQLADVNLYSRILEVRTRSSKNRYRNRTIPLTPEAQWAVERLLERAKALGATQPHHHLFPFRITTNRWDPARGMTESGIRKLWDEVRAKSGILWLRQYDLRHSGLSRLAEAGVPIQVMMDMAGHISRKMQQHYTHISDQAKRIAVESAFGGKKQQGSYQGRYQRMRETVV
jgi:integrase